MLRYRLGGYSLEAPVFLRKFSDFHEAFGISCLLRGLTAPWPDKRLRREFVSRMDELYETNYPPSPVMRALAALHG